MIGKGKKGSLSSPLADSMTPARFTIALMFILVAVLLAVGCVGNERINKTLIQHPLESNQTTIIPVSCKQYDNETYWIKINPIEDTPQGKDIFLTGTTNLPERTSLQARIILWDYIYSHCRACFDPTIHALITVKKGEQCINKLSWQIDTTNIPSMKSCTSSRGVNTWDRCYYKRYGIQVIFPGNVSVQDTIIFNLTENTEPQVVQSENTLKTTPDSASFQIQAMSDVKQGEVQTIYGIVNNPGPGTLFSIRTSGNKETCYEACSGEIIGGLIHFNSGRNPNPKSFEFKFNTLDFEPGSYLVDMKIINSNKTARTFFTITN